MKQIPIYKGISKKVTVFGPALVKDQKYRCAVFCSLKDEDQIYTITTDGTAQETEQGSGKVFVEFTFTALETRLLKLGDNNLAVYDVADGSATLDEYSMYKVYEAKVYAADSYARVEQDEEPEN